MNVKDLRLIAKELGLDITRLPELPVLRPAVEHMHLSGLVGPSRRFEGIYQGGGHRWHFVSDPDAASLGKTVSAQYRRSVSGDHKHES